MSALQFSPVFLWVSSYLFNALWQIPMIFAAGWIAARTVRRFGPYAEHRLWVGALALQIALPACSIRIGGLWSTVLTLLPSHHASGSGSVRVHFGPAVVAGSTLHLPLALEPGIVIAWAGVLAYFALRLPWGIVQTRTLARTAAPLVLPNGNADRWARHCARFRIAPPPELMVSRRTIAPI